MAIPCFAHILDRDPIFPSISIVLIIIRQQETERAKPCQGAERPTFSDMHNNPEHLTPMLEKAVETGRRRLPPTPLREKPER